MVPGCTGVRVAPPRYASTYQEDKHWVSHELNLSSSGDGPFQWLAGLYYYKEGYKQPVFTTMFDQAQLANAPSAAVPALTGPVSADNLRRPYDDRPQLQDESYAGFGQVDWKFAPEWKTTLGIRYSHDHKYGDESVRLVCFAVTSCLNGPGSTIVTPEGLGAFTPPVDVTAAVVNTAFLPAGVTPGGRNGVTFTPDGFAHRSYDDSWSAWTGTAGLQWDPDRDTMMYARYSRGYKAGGFNVRISTTLGGFPSTGAEHANSYEIGLKKDSFGRTLQTNLAAVLPRLPQLPGAGDHRRYLRRHRPEPGGVP